MKALALQDQRAAPSASDSPPAASLVGSICGPRVRGVTEPDLATLDSGQLVLLAQGRGPDAGQAWAVLVERNARLVWKKVRCFRLPEEASWEAYQSTWLRAIERLETLRDPECFPAWLATTARNEALAVIRARRKVVPSPSMFDRPADDPPPGERLQRDERCRAVRDGFTSLPLSCQDLLRLLTIDPPIPYKEIEGLLDMKHGSIGPTRRRCLDKLRGTPAMVAFLDGGR